MTHSAKTMDGMIEPGKAPESWGFMTERFVGHSYLWKEGDRIFISFIQALQPGKGHFSALVAAIEKDGFKVAVPTPLKDMKGILKRWKFKPNRERDKDSGEIAEVWMRE